jgi:effector-binding domain-containing protein
MITHPSIAQTKAQHTAFIPLTIAKHEIQQVMGPGISELMSTLAAQGIAPAGPWFTHHRRMLPDSWDFEISAPVAAPVTPAGRVKPGQWPAMRVARTVYQGPYEGLGEAWGAFLKWIESNGHRSAPDLYECYAAGPESSPDPAQWRTELIKPLMTE